MLLDYHLALPGGLFMLEPILGQKQSKQSSSKHSHPLLITLNCPCAEIPLCYVISVIVIRA